MTKSTEESRLVSEFNRVRLQIKESSRKARNQVRIEYDRKEIDYAEFERRFSEIHKKELDEVSKARDTFRRKLHRLERMT